VSQSASVSQEVAFLGPSVTISAAAVPGARDRARAGVRTGLGNPSNSTFPPTPAQAFETRPLLREAGSRHY
jgi:hypothetical protein